MSGIDPKTLPGRAVDLVYAAARAAGLDLWNIDLTFLREGPEMTVLPSVSTGRDKSNARAIFAHLGVTDPVFQSVPGREHARVVADVPALGMKLTIVVDPEPRAPLVDPAALVAEVDAAREVAAAEDTSSSS